MPLAWAIVQAACDLIAACLSGAGHRGAFWNVLAYEAIRVFVRAALPRVIESGEVEDDAGGALDVTIAVELGSVVNGDGLEQLTMGADELDHAAVGGGNGSIPKLPDEYAARDALDQADDAVAIQGAYDRVHLPVADLATTFNGGRTSGDMPLAGEAATLFGAAVAFPPLRRLS